LADPEVRLKARTLFSSLHTLWDCDRDVDEASLTFPSPSPFSLPPAKRREVWRRVDHDTPFFFFPFRLLSLLTKEDGKGEVKKGQSTLGLFFPFPFSPPRWTFFPLNGGDGWWRGGGDGEELFDGDFTSRSVRRRRGFFYSLLFFPPHPHFFLPVGIEGGKKMRLE